MNKETKIAFAVLGAFAVVCLIAAFVTIIVTSNQKQTFSPSSTSSQSQPAKIPPKNQEDSKPLEYKLAVINSGGYVPENDIAVSRFRYLLETLQRETGYTQQQIADANMYAVNTLRSRYGKNIKLLDFMESTLEPVRVRAGADYKEIVAAMIILMAK